MTTELTAPAVAPRAGAERFAARSRELLEARALALSVPDGRGGVVLTVLDAEDPADAGMRAALERATARLAATPDPEPGDPPPPGPAADGDGWVSLPVRRARTPRAGGLHVLPAPGWTPSRPACEALRVVAETALTIVGDPAEDPAARPELVAARILNRIALSASDEETMIAGITAAIAPVVDTAKAGVAIWSDQRRYLQSLPGSFGADAAMAASSQVDETDERSNAGRVWRTGRTRYSNDPADELPDFGDWIRAFGVRHLMTTPLWIEGRMVGVLHAANHRSGFGAGSVAAIESIAPFVASCVAIVRDRMDLRRNETMSDVVTQTATAVAAGQSLEPVSSVAFHEFCRTADIRVLAVSFAGDTAPRIVVREGEVDEDLARAFLAEATRPRMAVRTRLRRPRAAGDAGSSSLHAPVLAAGRHEATISVLRVPGNPFSDVERGAIRRLANIIALAWITEQYQQERAQMARVHERQRIADDLHDRVAQLLFSGELELQSLLEDLDDDAELRPRVARARDLLVRSEVSLREAIHQLTPPERNDVVARLRATVQNVEDEFGIAIHLEIAAGAEERAATVSGSVADVTLKAAREAMINTAKHAGPCRVWTTLDFTVDRLVVAVVDDGRGLPADQQDGYGLRSTRRALQEHGGTLWLSRGSAGTTKVVVSVPVPDGL